MRTSLEKNFNFSTIDVLSRKAPDKRGVRDINFWVRMIAFDQFYTDLEKKNFRGLNVPGPKCAGA